MKMEDTMEENNIIIYNTVDGKASVSLLTKNGTAWLNQAQLAELFGKAKSTISEHIKTIFEDEELDEKVVVREFRTTTKHGAIEGKTQNKILFAITGQTAAEIIVSRADADEKNMGIESYKGKVVRKQDIYTAKNYLSEDELDSLNRFVVVFLETAELRAKNRQDITMDFWQSNIDRIIEFNDKKLLKGYGSISHEQMKNMVTKVYEIFDSKRKVLDAQEADNQDMKELKQLEERVKTR